MTEPFPNQERILQAVFWQHLNLTTPEERARVGRDQIGDLGTMPWYIRLIKGPGGRSNRIEGVSVIDVEVFAPAYLLADSIANGLEAILLRYPHVVNLDGERVVVDSVDVNVSPHEIPWEDPAVSRVLATYVLTLRR